ncbi:unnamed protein product [Phytophthora lilii]|uniref:Unnamed protein product n=1 Tax=Phytophthora lilii TaxID=2077276 RepID=A0A9W6WWT9_9STRA|nr:unnamed protein product [Phytophthora lilii]
MTGSRKEKNTTALDNAIFRKLTHRKSDDEEFMEVCRVLLRHKATISWSDPDQYFLLKAKPDMDSSTIKARLQLVYQWEVQRKAGNTSFKLPIEVFRRGALDIAVYYSALFKGGRIRDSVAFKTDSKDYPEAIVGDSTNKLDQLLHDIENVSDRADSGDDSIFQHSFSQVSDFTCIKVTATTETLNTSGLVVETKRDDTGGRIIGGGSYAQSKAAKNIRDDRQSGEVADRENRSVDASKTEAKDIRSKGKVTPQKVTSIKSPDKSPPPKVIGGGSEQATHLASDHGTVGKTINHNPETSPVRELDSKGSSMSATTEGLSNLEKTHNDEKIESLELDNLLYRCEVCVVGPSRWGKTSFIKSFTSGSSTLEAMDARTIGIDLFPWSFDVATEGGECQYQVSFWDFAGQEEYRAAHTLFYSSRTLYLLCINLERYYNALSAATDTMNQTVDDSMMEAFAEMHIFRWARMITAHHPQAEFVFLGTKADLVHHDRSKILAIQQDFVMRFKANNRRMKDRVQRALQELKDAKFEIQDSDPITETIELDDQIASCEQILRKRPVLLSEELIIFSSADMKDKGVAREKVDMAFLFVTDLIGSACSSKFFRSEDEIIAALHLLHDTGDIVWFEGISEVRLLKERLFLDPLLVIEFVRQIINHKIDAVTAANGYVSHALLQSLPCWREINSTTMQQLKELLLHLHLAYSAGKAKRMAWNSDLIVPVY